MNRTILIVAIVVSNSKILIFDQHPELPLRHDYSAPMEMKTGAEEIKIKYEMNTRAKPIQELCCHCAVLRLGSFKYRKFIVFFQVKPIFPRKNRYNRDNKASSIQNYLRS